jgi:hypothetical protein
MTLLVDRGGFWSEAQRMRLLKLATFLCILAGEAYRTSRFLGI